MSHKQLTFKQRCHIYGLWRSGHNQTEIAKEIGVHKTTICRELKRNITFVRTALGSWQYKPGYAQGYAEERHKKKPKPIKFTKETDFYFAHPYFSRERALNENTNGLVRQYLKKGSDFSSIDNESLVIIMDRLNNRPRKTLNYATPNEIFNLV